MKGIYPIYKPKGPTSHDIINQLRRITGIKKIGHAGTLDPLASGVLVVGITREGTKKMHELVKKEKEYLAAIQLGETSTTDDAEGEKTVVTGQSDPPTQEEVEKTIPQFIGRIQQIPPVYSALKIKGQPAYKLARKGKAPEMQSREVEIKEIELVSYDWPMLRLRVVTGPGVYIRSLARDIGEALGVGAYLADLERTRVGDFTKSQAYTLEDFASSWQKELSI